MTLTGEQRAEAERQGDGIAAAGIRRLLDEAIARRKRAEDRTSRAARRE